MQNIEEKIAELRLTEAIQKDLYGQSGKLFTIVKTLGSEIIQDNFLNNQIDYFNDEVSEDKINEFDLNHTSTIIGYHFDALRFGFALEIVYKENYSKLQVLWQSRTVYQEEDGQLTSYVPLNEWENKIDYFHKLSVDKIKKNERKTEKENNSRIQTEEDNQVKKLKERWGIT